MAFDTIVANEDMNAANVQQIIDCLAGTSGGGQQLLFNQYNNSSNYALTVRNLDTTNGYALKVTDAADAVLIQAYKNTLQLGAAAANDTLSILCNISGKVFIGDSANASLTVGLTINQAANDDEIISLKSSDVAHGVTGETETDTWLFVKKYSDTNGGAKIEALCDTGTRTMHLVAVGVTDNTTHTASGDAYFVAQAYKKSTTNAGAPGADANLLGIANNANFVFLFDNEGSAFAEVEWTTYDRYDDLALVADMEAELLVHEDAAQTARRHYLEQAGVVGKDSWHIVDGRQKAMVNFTKLQMLHHGALLQVAGKLDDISKRLALTESKLAALPPATT